MSKTQRIRDMWSNYDFQVAMGVEHYAEGRMAINPIDQAEHFKYAREYMAHADYISTQIRNLETD